MSVTTAAAGAAARASRLRQQLRQPRRGAQQLRQLGDVGGDAPRLVPGEPLIDRAAVRAAGNGREFRVGGRPHQRPRLAQLSPFYGWEEKARREAGL